MKIRAQLCYHDGRAYQVILKDVRYPHPTYVVRREYGVVQVFVKIEVLARQEFRGERVDVVAYREVCPDDLVESNEDYANWEET